MSWNNLRWVVRDGVKVLQELHYVYSDQPVPFSDIGLNTVFMAPIEPIPPTIVWVDVPVEEENINE